MSLFTSSVTHSLGVPQLAAEAGEPQEEGVLFSHFLRTGLPPFLALVDIGFVPDHKENEWNLSASSLRARFIGRNRILWSFFHVFIVTVKIGLLLSMWRHFYCSPFLTCPQAQVVTAEASQAWDSVQTIACVERFLLPGFPGWGQTAAPALCRSVW